jgi:site-specific recombinase XerD
VLDEFKRLLAKAGLPTKHRVHDLRHSRGTHMVAAGVHQRLIMDALGHSTLAMTQRYTHALPSMAASAAAQTQAYLAARRRTTRAGDASS